MFRLYTVRWDSISQSTPVAGVNVRKSHRTVTVTIDKNVNISDYWSVVNICTLAAEYRPSFDVFAPVSLEEMTTTAIMAVGTNGALQIKNLSGTSIPGNRGVFGMLTYCV